MKIRRQEAVDQEYRRKGIDIVFRGELSFSLAVPLRFAENQRVGRVGRAGTEGPGSHSCVCFLVTLNKRPGVSQGLASPPGVRMACSPSFLARQGIGG